MYGYITGRNEARPDFFTSFPQTSRKRAVTSVRLSVNNPIGSAAWRQWRRHMAAAAWRSLSRLLPSGTGGSGPTRPASAFLHRAATDSRSPVAELVIRAGCRLVFQELLGWFSGFCPAGEPNCSQRVRPAYARADRIKKCVIHAVTCTINIPRLLCMAYGAPTHHETLSTSKTPNIHPSGFPTR